MIIYRQQYEQIETATRRDFLTQLEGYVRRKNPSALSNTPREAVPAKLNASINKAGTFGLDRELEVERFVTVDLALGSDAPRFFARQDVKAVQHDRHRAAAERVGKLELLAQASSGR